VGELVERDADPIADWQVAGDRVVPKRTFCTTASPAACQRRLNSSICKRRSDEIPRQHDLL
jgi:hypothetical protein